MTLPQCGVHFGINDDAYFNSGALGSTDLKTLLRSPADWWYGSRHNTNKIETSKKHFDFGKALHALILEGDAAYQKLVVISPFENFRTKVAQEWKDDQTQAGRAILTDSEDTALRHMAAIVSNHPDLDGLKTHFLKEVAVIWEEGGIYYRAKFDAINPVFGLDLKTYSGANTQGRDPYDTAMRFIAMRDYDIQRAHYDTARSEMRQFIKKGQVFGATPDQQVILDEIAKRDLYAWVWLFYQKVDHAAGKGPIVMPIAVQDGDITFRTGVMKINAAMKNYRGFVKRFGLDTPWAQIQPLRWAQDTDFVPWMGDVAPPQFDDEEIDQ